MMVPGGAICWGPGDDAAGLSAAQARIARVSASRVSGMFSEFASSASMRMHRTIARAEGSHCAARSSIVSSASRAGPREGAKDLFATVSAPAGVRDRRQRGINRTSTKPYPDGARGEFRVDPALIVTLDAAGRGTIGRG
jgi:hypothetical protein